MKPGSAVVNFQLSPCPTFSSQTLEERSSAVGHFFLLFSSIATILFGSLGVIVMAEVDYCISE